MSWPQPWEQAPVDRLTPPPHLVSPLPVAVDTQTGEWAWIDAVDDGPVFAVAGPPKSGRSTAMATMARLASRAGWSVLNVRLSRRSPLATWDDPAITRQVAAEELAAALDARDGNVLVLLDDLQRLTSYDPLEAALNHRDGSCSWSAARPTSSAAGWGCCARSPSPVPGCCWRRPDPSTAAPSACAG